MKIISEELVARYGVFDVVMISISVLILLVLIPLMCWTIKEKLTGVSLYLFTCVASFIFAICTAVGNPDKYVRYVTAQIPYDAPFGSITEQYEVVGKKGDTYVLKDVFELDAKSLEWRFETE